ncbi:MAG: nodulation protein NfeD [Phycisphaerae bacterium]
MICVPCRKCSIALALLVAGPLGSVSLTGAEDPPDAVAEVAPRSAVTPAPSPSRKSAIVPITGEISDVTTQSLERRVGLAQQAGAEVIIFEIDTPGGAVIAALDICDFIKNLTDIHTVAWVHTQAISAGSMIATSCNEIVMSPASSIGDCGVIMGTPMGAEEIPEGLKAKAQSPVLAQFRDSATRNGYSKALCEALVVQDKIVWWLENSTNGKRVFVDDRIKIARLGAGDDPTTQPATDPPREWKLVESYVDSVSGREVPVDQPIVDETELLTMSQSEAIAYGFAQGVVGSQGELKTRYNLAGELVRFDFTWSETLVGYLTSMPVRIFLLIIILLGAYVEFHTPGVGVAGLASLIGLTIFVGAPYLTGLAGAVELIFIVLGIALLLLEIFVVPGFGLPGIAGILMILMGMFWTFVPAEPGPWHVVPTMEGTWQAIRQGFFSMVMALVASLIAMWYLSKWLPQSGIGRKLILDAEAVREQDLGIELTTVAQPSLNVGDRGIAISTLRPAGKARIRGEAHDVVTEGEMIDQGGPLEIIDVQGNRVVVRGTEDQA